MKPLAILALLFVGVADAAIDTDYFGKKRSTTNPTAGPFENPDTGALRLRVR
jgi:hypothetical protein